MTLQGYWRVWSSWNRPSSRRYRATESSRSTTSIPEASMRNSAVPAGAARLVEADIVPEENCLCYAGSVRLQMG